MRLIVNPTAARGRGEREGRRVERTLAERGVAFTSRRTSAPREATALAREALVEGEEAIVAIGGDGTLNEVVNGYFDAEGRALNPRAALGLVPCGTGSDFQRTLGLGSGTDALAAALAGKTRLFDTMRIAYRNHAGDLETRMAINMISMGLGGDSVVLVDSWRDVWPRWIGGYPRFALAAMLNLRRYRNRRVDVRLDGRSLGTIDSYFIAIGNGRFAGGGMRLAPNASPEDGLLDVVLTDRATAWDVLCELPRIRRGLHLRNSKVREHKGAAVEFLGDDPLAVDVDGEGVGYTPARITVFPRSIRFFVP